MSDTERKPVILLAEDEEGVRRFVNAILEQARYCVLQAEDGRKALEVAERHDGPIHLLLSNVVMPEVTGAELAKRLQAVRPEMRVMLMSAYPEGMLTLDTGWQFINKPFVATALLQKIDEMLARPPKPLSGEIIDTH